MISRHTKPDTPLLGNVVTSQRKGQLSEIDSLEHTLQTKYNFNIQREKLEKAFLRPEEVVLPIMKPNLNIEMLIRNRRFMPVNPRNMTSQSDRSSGDVSLASLKGGSFSSSMIKSSNMSLHKSKNMRKLPMFIQLDTDDLNALGINRLDTVQEKIVPVKEKRKKAFTFSKMVVKPVDLKRSESDQNLSKSVGTKVDSWWTYSKYKEMKKKYPEWKRMKALEKENVAFVKMHGPPEFHSLVPNRLSTPELANKNTKYIRPGPSIDEFPVGPHQTKSYVEFVQSTSQGKHLFRRQSHFLPSDGGQRHSSGKRPTSASLFHPQISPFIQNAQNAQNARRRSLSVGSKPHMHKETESPAILQSLMEYKPTESSNHASYQSQYMQMYL